MTRRTARTRLGLYVLLIAFIRATWAHMELVEPLAVYSKQDPQTEEANKDYSMTAPLEKDGSVDSNYPAKSRCTAEILSALSPVATLVSGEDFTWDLLGTAVHNGGSCQVGVSYDNCDSMVVIASWIGGCPLSLPYTFKVPDLPGADKAFFWWSWSNQSGNRELYQNVAVVAITGSASEFTGPTVFRANTFGEDSCINPEGTDVVYPAPGDQVFYGGKYSEGSPPTASPPDCPDYDNTKILTVRNSGGGSGPAAGEGDGGGDKPSKTASKSDDGPKETGGEGDPKPSATGGGDGTASAATSSSKTSSAATGGSTGGGSLSGGDEDDEEEEEAGGSGSTTAKPTNSGSSASSSSSTDSEASATFIKFALAAVALIALGGLAVCLLRRRSTSDDYDRANDSEESSDSASDSDDYYEKKRSKHGRHSKKHGHRHHRR